MDLNRIAELAKQDAGCRFHSIAHFLTKEALWGAFDGLRKGAAAGVDGVWRKAWISVASRRTGTRSWIRLMRIPMAATRTALRVYGRQTSFPMVLRFETTRRDWCGSARRF